MDTKTSAGPLGRSDFDFEEPPSYSDTISSFPITNTSASPSSYYSTQISSQLRVLTTQISSLQTQKTLLGHAKEENILACLTTHIQTYLSDFATTGLNRGTLILIPANGSNNKDAKPTDAYFRDPDDYDRMVKVRGKGDDAEDDTWFWHDEKMAERLARCLRPAQDPSSRALPPRKEELKIKEEKKESKGFWSWKRSSIKTPAIEESRDEKCPTKSSEGDTESDDRVIYDVKAETVSLRSENEWGIFEMEKGFGIVLRLRVMLSRK